MKLLMARWLLGIVLLAAGLPKAAHPEDFAAQVAAYQVLPSSLIVLAALAIPRMEVLAGLGLVAGCLTRSSALLAGLLSLAFALATGSALARGLDIDCGCLPVRVALTWMHPLLNLGMAALALAILRHRACSSADE